MNIEKLSIIFNYIGIAFVIVLLSGVTYAYLNDEDKIDNNKLNESIIVEYVNTSNVSMVNFKPGEKVIKEFNVLNNGNKKEYYNINLEDVVNNFADGRDLVYSLESDNGAYVYLSDAPNSDVSIASNVVINPNEIHKYILTLSFNKTNKNQDNNLNKTFSSIISISSSDNAIKYDKGSIGYEIVNNVTSSFKNGTANFYEDGIYYTNNSMNGSTIYFYRGSNNLNNNAVFGNNCYKIIRTTEDGGIRIIYNGPYTDGKCSNSNNILENVAFNNKANYNAYVGYMYGNASSNSYDSEHRNLNSSNIKIFLDSWYSTNISRFNEFIDTTSIYCNNRNLKELFLNGVYYGELGYGNYNTAYELMSDYYDDVVSYDCSNFNDRFSVNNEFGNDVLTNSVGLISVEELYYAGFNSSLNNSDNYLYSNDPYWTMTSAYFNGSNAYNFIVNKGVLSTSEVNKKYGVRPVITLKANTIILSGNGSLDNPYVLFRRML